jgi:hypothetical protein
MPLSSISLCKPCADGFHEQATAILGGFSRERVEVAQRLYADSHFSKVEEDYQYQGTEPLSGKDEGY